MKLFATICLGIALFAMGTLAVSPVMMHVDMGDMGGMQECNEGVCAVAAECADHCIAALAESDSEIAVVFSAFVFVLTAIVTLTVFAKRQQFFFVIQEWFRPFYQFTTVQLIV